MIWTAVGGILFSLTVRNALCYILPRACIVVEENKRIEQECVSVDVNRVDRPTVSPDSTEVQYTSTALPPTTTSLPLPTTGATTGRCSTTPTGPTVHCPLEPPLAKKNTHTCSCDVFSFT
eukprot:GHVR01015459.1.p1 GENE.GHVR01015459.1~~GHVR01015459.1.p1  ORF type:complete len:120 (-),score=17.88 GHVR01015459.1:124-483(-)